MGRSPGIGNGKPLQYSCLKIAHGQRAWGATVHWVTNSQTQLSTHATSKYMPIKWTTWKKWTNSKKSTIFQDWTRKEEKIWTDQSQRLKSKLSLKIFQQTKARGQIDSQQIQLKVYRRANTYPTQALPKNWRGRKSPQFILRSKKCHNAKIRQKYQEEKEKPQAYITDECRHKNLQNSIKENPITH